MKIYLDTTSLLKIVNNKGGFVDILKFDCVTSMQSILELCSSSNIRIANNIIFSISDFCKIRSIDFDCALKFNNIINNSNLKQTPDYGLMIHISVALNEKCDYFVTEDENISSDLFSNLKFVKLSDIIINQEFSQNGSMNLFGI